MLRRCLLLLVATPLLVACDKASQSEQANYSATTQSVYEYLGVPFAEPPVGKLRWEAPQALPDGSAKATGHFQPGCAQTDYMVTWYHDVVTDFGGDAATFPVPEFSEDCLYLNIWTPDNKPTANLPVMVWIHGGGLRGGWAYEPNYVGDKLAKQGVVIVSIAYRLDIFGFISHPKLNIANFGLLDQIAALEWIQQNIRNYGGNPDAVTVFGESAGGASIGYLLDMEAAKGLFHRAIIQSAGYHLPTEDLRADYLDQWQQTEVPALANGTLQEMRNLEPDLVLAAAAKAYPEYRPDVVVDGQSVLRLPGAALQDKTTAAVDLMIGTNADEWLMYLPESTSDENVLGWITDQAPNSAEKIQSELADDPLRNLDRLTTAANFVCPSLQMATYTEGAGGKAYVYYFDRVRDSERARALGAYHGAEIPYVFDKHDDWLPTDAADRDLTQTMQQYWVNFARTGNPNRTGLPEWRPYSASDSNTLRLGDELGMNPHVERNLCDYLSQSGASQLQ